MLPLMWGKVLWQAFWMHLEHSLLLSLVIPNWAHYYYSIFYYFLLFLWLFSSSSLNTLTHTHSHFFLCFSGALGQMKALVWTDFTICWGGGDVETSLASFFTCTVTTSEPCTLQGWEGWRRKGRDIFKASLVLSSPLLHSNYCHGIDMAYVIKEYHLFLGELE